MGGDDHRLVASMIKENKAGATVAFAFSRKPEEQSAAHKGIQGDTARSRADNEEARRRGAEKRSRLQELARSYKN